MPACRQPLWRKKKGRLRAITQWCHVVVVSISRFCTCAAAVDGAADCRAHASDTTCTSAIPGLGDVRRDPQARRALLEEVHRLASLTQSQLSIDVPSVSWTDPLDTGPELGGFGQGSSGPLSGAQLGVQLVDGDQSVLDTLEHSPSGNHEDPSMVEALAEAHNSLAVEMLERNRYSAAEPEIRKALSYTPAKAELIYNLGVVMSGLKRHAEAQDAYERALNLRESLHSAHFNLARTHMSRANSVETGGDFGDFWKRRRHLKTALQHLEQSVDASSPPKSHEEIYKSMEECHYQLGDHGAAWAAYEQYLATCPHEGLQTRQRDNCQSVAAWLEDKLLELPLPERHNPGVYPELPDYVRADLCADSSPTPLPVSRKLAAQGRRWWHRKRRRSSELRKYFRRNAYAELPGSRIPWSRDSVAFFASYFGSLRRAGKFYKDAKDDPKALLSAGRWSLDNDRLAMYIADQLVPIAEEAAGKRMKLGFAKVAIYEGGAELPDHHDQILNEVSISLVLQSTPKGVTSTDWPLVLRPPPQKNASSPSVTPNISLTAPIGAGLLFRGRDFLHGRGCCLQEGESSMVLLLHYIQADFPEFSCRALVNVTSVTKDDLLQHQCQRAPSTLGVEAAAQRAGGHHEKEYVPVVGVLRHPPKYLLYNPCATNLDPGYCQSQFNNQVVFFLHALSVARTLGRTLVLPPFMWMEHQMADDQNWFPFEHFFDVEHLRERFDVVRLEDFVDRHNLRQPGGDLLWWYYYPPYLVDDQPNVFQARFFRSYMNISFAWPKRMSPFWQVAMAASGRGGEVPYSRGEGHGYWSAARLLLGKFRAESADFHEALGAQIHSTSLASWLGFGAGGSGQAGGRDEAELVNRQSEDLRQWFAVTGKFDIGKALHPIENETRYRAKPKTMLASSSAAEAASMPVIVDASGRSVSSVDVLAFDFAPSYNFRVDRFNFDAELMLNRRALRFREELDDIAVAVVADLFQDQRFVALHLRRDGYSEFCHAESLRAAAGLGKLRFGFLATPESCDPSIEDVMLALKALGEAEQLGLADGGLYVATNSRGEEELLESLRGRLQDEFGATLFRLGDATTVNAVAPEFQPVVDLLVAARANAFVGNVVSTFSMNVLMERDLRGAPRRSTVFSGLGTYEQWSGEGFHNASEVDEDMLQWLPLAHASATQSSTAFGGESYNAIDGIPDPIYSHGHCTHTAKQLEPWWRLDFDIPHAVQRVRITTRADCCADRLEGVEVWLTQHRALRHREGTRCASTATQTQPWQAGETRTLPCKGVATALWITLPGPSPRELTLCSVEVAAEPMAVPLQDK